MRIERARTSDGPELTELTIRSKSHWGYSSEQIGEWQDELTVTEDYLVQHHVYTAHDADSLIGYYALRVLDREEASLDNLFVEARLIGQGFGRKLILDALQRARDLDLKRVVLESDPNAEDFYSKVGFKQIGKLETAIEGRYLPVMSYELT